MSADIVSELAGVSISGVFNPWRDADECDVERAHAPEKRRERLRQHFEVDAKYILVGEAPGYQGCRVSGIPFTSEALLIEGAIPRVEKCGRLTNRERPWSEPAARVMWQALYRSGVANETVLWNAFPFHPYQAGKPYSNRRPTVAEVKAHSWVLHALIEKFVDAKVIAVGRVAESVMNIIGVKPFMCVRHPSYGGAPEFRSALLALAAGPAGN